MTTPKRILSATVAAFFVAAALGFIASAQQVITKKATAEEWAALAKLPDFNGVWERGGGGGGRGGAVAAPAANAGAQAPRGAPAGAAATPAGQRGLAAPAGRGGGRGGGVQLTPEYEAKRAAYKAPEDSETANCLPPGMPGIMTQPYPMEFLLTPGKVTIVIEAYTQVRHIYTDGRKLPEDPDPKFFGTSVGRWEGDTLVVETVGFAPHLTLTAGVPHSGKMKIVERYRLADPENMSIETTITDPVALLAPITTNANLRRHREWTITEYICEENNRNAVDAQGRALINITPPVTR
jgi:hypothetical protein